MRFHVLTLFPGMFASPLGEGLIAKARERGLVDWTLTDLRDFATDRHRTVDDVPFGGGEGMVLKPDVVSAALDHAAARAPGARRVFLTPQGRPFTQAIARELKATGEVILLCGRYEGVDERALESRIDDHISIGDYVLGGGEIAALVLMETVFRLVPGVVGNTDSVDHDCFEDGLLKYPQYTRPAEFEGRAVPEVLLSGHHDRVAAWRGQRQLERTIDRRPDLFRAYFAAERAEAASRLYVALLHYPVRNKSGDVVTTAVTNADIHDIARACRTYGVKHYFLVTPIDEQRRLVGEIIGHWTDGEGARRNATRHDAFRGVSVVRDLEEAKAAIGRREKQVPLVMGTSAREDERSISYDRGSYLLAHGGRPTLLCFGTGSGLTDEFLSSMDTRLEPVRGVGDYNHLSVRSAVSIILDRLLGG
jgi:tRNA (guanine37-N1)-methyltransferase